MPPTSASVHRRWALLCLVVTVIAGTWMRAILAWPSAGLGIDFTHLRHAHSHVAFFGWVTMAIFSLMRIAAILVAGDMRRARQAPLLRLAAGALAIKGTVEVVAALSIMGLLYAGSGGGIVVVAAALGIIVPAISRERTGMASGRAASPFGHPPRPQRIAGSGARSSPTA